MRRPVRHGPLHAVEHASVLSLLEALQGEWSLLWQIGSDDASGFTWGDMGNLYLLIRDQDLRARRFDKAWLGLQCG